MGNLEISGRFKYNLRDGIIASIFKKSLKFVKQIYIIFRGVYSMWNYLENPLFEGKVMERIGPKEWEACA